MDGDGSAIPLSQLRGYRIANGALDMRGWDVYSADGRRIGDVDEVLVDTGAMQVRYLDVEVEKLVATGRERHVLIPVHRARRDPALSRAVVVEGLAARGVPRLPSYARGAAVHGPDAGTARPLAEADPGAAGDPVDLPIRVEPPLMVRPIRLAAPAEPSRTPADPPLPADVEREAGADAASHGSSPRAA